MYCTACGTELSPSYRFCHQCGTPCAATGAPDAPRRLSRPRDDRKIAGVCSGIARYLGMDATLVRILVVCLTIWPPSVGFIFYIVCWIVMPRDPFLLPPPVPNSGVVPSSPGMQPAS